MRGEGEVGLPYASHPSTQAFLSPPWVDSLLFLYSSVDSATEAKAKEEEDGLDADTSSQDGKEIAVTLHSGR